MRKGGAHSHLSRWYDFMNQLAPLAAVLDKHRPKRLTAPEYFKARAEAGKGGGGEQIRLQQLACTGGAEGASLQPCMDTLPALDAICGMQAWLPPACTPVRLQGSGQPC